MPKKESDEGQELGPSEKGVKEEVKAEVEDKKDEQETEQETEQKDAVKSVEVKDGKPKVSWGQRLKEGLERSRAEVWGKLESVFFQNQLDDDSLRRNRRNPLRG